MSALLLIVAIAGERVGLRSCQVESVVELDAVVPVPRAAPHVAGLSALRSRVLTVIDTRRSLDLAATERADGLIEAVVVELDGHHYALVVDDVEDVVEVLGEPTPVRGTMAPGWERVALGMVETDGGPILLVDVAGLVGGPEAPRAAAA